MHQADTPLFSPFFLNTKGNQPAHPPRHKRHQPTRSEGGSKTQNNTPRNTPINTYGGRWLGKPPLGGWCVWGACCKYCSAAVLRRCCSFGQCAGVPGLWVPVRQVCWSASVLDRLASVAGGSGSVASVCAVVSAVRRLCCGGLLLCLGIAKSAGKLAPALSAFVGALGALGFSWLFLLA